MVFPEIYAAASRSLGQTGRWGDEPSRRAGWGHELHALRTFRPGDDPRSHPLEADRAHRQPDLHGARGEESRRLSMVFDNAVGRAAPMMRRATVSSS